MNGGSIAGQSQSFRDYKAIFERAEFILLDHQARSDASGFQQNGETVLQLDAQVQLDGLPAFMPQLARHAVKKGVDDNLATLKDFSTKECRSAFPVAPATPALQKAYDVAPLWAKGEYFPLAFSREKVEQVTRHRLKLKPAAK